MNRGVFQSSLVQQMMGQSPNWWSMNNTRLPPEQTFSLLPSSSSSSSAFPQYPLCSYLLPLSTPWHDNQDLPESWSQLLLGGNVEEEDKNGLTPFQPKKTDNWEDQVLYSTISAQNIPDIKQDFSGTGEEITQAYKGPWSQILPATAGSSPRSCITTSFSSNSMLDFSNNKAADKRHKKADNSSECNSTASGASFKKARVQGSSSAQSTFKVRKEKLGDRITALHQLVSPFGKTDTASVLLEAIGYIRFLQSQIEALSSPYLGNGSGNKRQHVQGERTNLFPQDPGQLLNGSTGMKKGGGPHHDQKDGNEEPQKDLRSRGLCLVPVTFTSHFGGDNGADFWAPALGGGF